MKQAPPFLTCPVALCDQICYQGSGYTALLSTRHLGDRQCAPVTVHAPRYKSESSYIFEHSSLRISTDSDPGPPSCYDWLD